MDRFENILCVVMGRKSCNGVLQRAVSLAENNQARLTAIAVAPRVSIGMGMSEGGPISNELQAAMVKERAQELEAVVAPFRGRVKILTKVVVGEQFLEIIREVLRNRHDLMVKATEIHEWLDHLLGSEDMHLLRKCPCPVWLIKPSSSKSFRRVLAAVDVHEIYPSSEMKVRMELNQKILEMASSLALADFAELHVVHAWEAEGESALLNTLMHMPEEKVKSYIGEVQQLREEGLNQLMHRMRLKLGQEAMDFLQPQLHLVKGGARREIPALARKLDADLVVMGTVARTGIPGYITGNTAETILGQLNCSVLAIKPSGFKTPVTLVDRVTS